MSMAIDIYLNPAKWKKTTFSYCHVFLDPTDLPLCTTAGSFAETCTASGILGNSVIVTVKTSNEFDACKNTLWTLSHTQKYIGNQHIFSIYSFVKISKTYFPKITTNIKLCSILVIDMLTLTFLSICSWYGRHTVHHSWQSAMHCFPVILMLSLCLVENIKK